MYTKFLSAFAAIAALGVAGHAAAQLPPGIYYDSGEVGWYPGSAIDGSGYVRVSFYGTLGDVDWTPETSSLTYHFGTYHKSPDGTSGYIIADPPDYYELATQTWKPLPVGSGGYGSFAAWGDRFVWVAYNGTDHYVVQYDLSTNTFQNHLAYNGIDEYDLSLSGDRIAYTIDPWVNPKIVVHDFNVGYLYSEAGYRPDVLGDRVTWIKNGGTAILWKDFIGGADGGFGPPGSCTSVQTPLFVGDGRWIAYSAYCGSVTELRVFDTLTHHDQHIADLGDAYFHAGEHWLVWADARGHEIRAYIFGAAVPPVPVDDSWDSGERGNDPAFALDGNGNPHVVFTNHKDTLDWVPGSTPQVVGKPMRAYDGHYRFVAAESMGEIWHYDIDSQGWNTIGKGEYPSAFSDVAAWNDRYQASDLAIASNFWGTISSFDLLDQSLPAVFKEIAAIEYHDGVEQDVQVIDLTSGSVLQHIAGSTHQRQPDLWDIRLVYVDDTLGLRYRPDYSLPYEYGVPVPAGCAARLPRLGNDGEYVLYEAYGCNASGLYVVNMGSSTPVPYYVGKVAPPRGFTPQYAALQEKDWIVFVDAAAGGEVRAIDLGSL